MRARSTRSVVLLATAMVLVASAWAPDADAAAGFPDPTFGSGGFSILDDPAGAEEDLQDLVLQPDGKILAGGSRAGIGGFLLARFNPDGTTDAGFGTGGIRVEPDEEKAGSPRAIEAIAARPDGKIVAAGLGRSVSGEHAFEFARYTADGVLDPTFGDGGLRMVEVDPFGGSAKAVALAPDQKVVGVGDGGEAAAVVRLTESGEPDPSFNAAPAGVRKVDIPMTSADDARAVTVLPGGTILLGGGSFLGAFLAELDSNGNPVAGFGTAGVAIDAFATGSGTFASIEDLEVLDDRQIIATGSADVGGVGDELIVARFTPAGNLDPSFAGGGVFRSDPTNAFDDGQAVEVQPDGKIVVAGRRGTSGSFVGDTWLLRLTPDGRLDTSFGSGGEAIANAAPGRDEAFGLALQQDGRPVIVGAADAGINTSQLLAGRFTADPVATPISAAAKARCAGKSAAVVGTGRADKLKGTKKRDVIAGLGGNDNIKGLAGNDIVCGGGGRDLIQLGKGRDRGLGEGGPDRILGGPGKDQLLGAKGSDLLSGGPGADLCNGGAGRDGDSHGCETRKKLP